MGHAHDYAAAIMRRGRVPMEPVDFVPDWPDGPRKGKFYPGAESFPLPPGDVPPDATVEAALSGGQRPGTAVPFTLPLLGGMLLDSYGRTGRRLGVQANSDLGSLPSYADANWSRGSASGGGLYPVSVYWVCGPSGPLTPGVYHYATTHHAMRRLLAGDVSGEVRAALAGHEQAARTDQFLVLGVKFWQNAFKYNSFCMHAVSMDVGAALQTWRLWARARGAVAEPALWFDEERLGRLLGVDILEEGVFAVVPLTWEGPTSAAGAPDAPVPPVAAPAGPPSRRPPAPRVRRREQERSRRVIAFDAVRRVQAAMVAGAAQRPGPGALAEAAPHPAPDSGGAVPLPAPLPLPMTVRAALRRRRSSFGRFDAQRAMTAAQLGTLLAASADCPLGEPTVDAPPLAKLYVFVNHVDGIAPGAYAYIPAAHALRPVTSGPPGRFLQDSYFLSNYNLEQAGAVVVPAVRTTAVLDALGDRGYRVVNAGVGATAQTFYTTAAALGLGSGVALGFDNVVYVEELGLEGSDEAPLLIMLVGHERPDPADFRYELV
ncbi:nitroreductase family protein [Streptomyces gamaensis]|uniref:Nitroreductase family protein n=1 Tax=Streptomyces gamaensis TaxID=1763542 RepID=A0ABW0YYM7_9ACTN